MANTQNLQFRKISERSIALREESANTESSPVESKACCQIHIEKAQEKFSVQYELIMSDFQNCFSELQVTITFSVYNNSRTMWLHMTS